MNKTDLHVHTTASDGTLNPEQVVRLALEKGLSTLAITDHDTLTGYYKARDIANELGIRLIPGIEITSDYKGKECHILAYCVDVEHPRLNKMLANQKKIRVVRARKMVCNLNKLGFDIDYDDVLAEAGNDSVSRVHIAAALENKSYVANKKEAFDRYLADNGPAYYKSEYIPAAEIIAFIKSVGGVSILAHPGLNYIYEDLRFFIKSGLDGIEYIHPSHNYELQKKYMNYANNYGLLLTGGSDFHGFRYYDFDNFGTICIDTDLSEKLLTLGNQRKALITN